MVRIARFFSVALVVLGSMSRASASPIVHVKGETVFDVRVSSVEDHTVIYAALRDGFGVESHIISNVFFAQVDRHDGHPQRITRKFLTAGELDIRPALDGHATITLTFGGNDDYERSERVVEYSPHESLVMRAEIVGARQSAGDPSVTQLNLDVPHHSLRVSATQDDRAAADVAIVVADELGRALANGHTDALGVVQLTISSSSLAPPGYGKLFVKTVDEPTGIEGSQELAVLRFLPTKTSFFRDSPGETENFHGRVTDWNDTPLAGVSVAITLDATRVASALTDENGDYKISLASAEIENGGDLRATIEPSAPWYGVSSSSAIHIARALKLSLVATVFCASVLLTLIGWWLSERRAKRATPLALRSRVETQASFEAGRAKGFRAEILSVDVLILDRLSDAPLSAATLAIVGVAERRDVSVDKSGRAEFELSPGKYALHVTCPGFAAADFTVHIPHRGEWTGARLRLDNLRSRALDALSPLAQIVRTPQASATPREIATRLSRQAGGGPGAEIALRAESAAFNVHPPTEAEVARLERDRDHWLHIPLVTAKRNAKSD